VTSDSAPSYIHTQRRATDRLEAGEAGGPQGWVVVFVASYFSSTDVSMSFFAAGDYDREMRDAMIQPARSWRSWRTARGGRWRSSGSRRLSSG
jgi:hypothetical protein